MNSVGTKQDITQYVDRPIHLNEIEERLYAMSRDMNLFSPKLAIMNDEQLTETPLTPSESQHTLFRVNDHIKYVLKQPVRIEALKGRQVYFSLGTAALSFRDIYFNSQPKRHTVISYDWTSVRNIMEMLWRFAAKMPGGMQIPYLPIKSKGEYGMRFPHSGASIDSLSGETDDPGRGGNRYFLHASEVAMFRVPRDLWNAVAPSVPKIAGTTIIRETTARGYDDYFQPSWAEREEFVRHYCREFGAVDEMDLLFNRTGWGNKPDRYGKKHPNGWWMPGEYFPVFMPWWKMRKYRRNPEFEELTLEKCTRFERQLMETCDLDLWQMAWRRFSIRTEYGGRRVYADDDPAIAEFDQENPWSSEVAFKSTGRPYISRSVVSMGLAHSTKRAAETYVAGGLTRHVLQPVAMKWARGREPHYEQWHNCTNRDKLAVEVRPVESSDLLIYKTPYRDPKYYTERQEKGKKVTYKSRTWSHRYVIGADIAEGLAQGDYSCAFVLDRVEWEFVAMYHGHPSTLEFAEILAQMAIYYDDAWIMGEYNKYGSSIVPRILTLYRNLCNRPKVQTGKLGDADPNSYWMVTSPRSKTELSDYLKEAIESKPFMLLFPRFWKEAEKYAQHDDGTIGAEGKHKDPKVGNHDDAIIAAGEAIVGDRYAPRPMENVVPRYASNRLQKKFRESLRSRSPLDDMPAGIRKSQVL